MDTDIEAMVVGEFESWWRNRSAPCREDPHFPSRRLKKADRIFDQAKLQVGQATRCSAADQCHSLEDIAMHAREVARAYELSLLHVLETPLLKQNFVGFYLKYGEQLGQLEKIQVPSTWSLLRSAFALMWRRLVELVR